MADNTTTVHVNVTDDGTVNKVNKDVLTLKKNLEGTAAAARTPLATAAAKQGLSSAMSKGANDASDSNTARGIGGLRGAEGRDFAAQARGLGGLVHVYATFAANIFALTAAFGALSRAADTTNLVRGLDQLGAASGRGLGSLAKQLVQVTDGALSLRDSLSATALASAGGMSSQNLLRLGNVAKTASQALGINMTDAVSRLSRGITKLEPELLDEIGIMVRLDKSSQDYARTLGKNVASLSEFERRQGFANAVLEQGEKKFGAISLNANPYDKILASIQNVTQLGLELVNKVLGPIADILSKSPLALTTALAGVATLLLKQALPAVTQWRQGLIEAGKAANDAAIKANELRKLQQIGGAADLYGKEDDLARRSGSIRDVLDGIKRKSKATNDLLKQSSKELTEQVITDMEKQAKKRSDFTAAQAKHSIDTLEKVHMEGRALTELAKVERERFENNKKISELETVKPKTFLSGVTTYLSQDAARDRIAARAQARAQSSGILANVAETLPAAGIKDSFIKLGGEIKKAMSGIEEGVPRMTKFAAATTALKGTVAILTTGITTLAMSLGNVFAILGIVTVIFQGFNAVFEKSAKEAEAFSSALDSLNAAADTVGRTLEVISKKSPMERISVESIQARATALYELSEAMGSLISRFDKLTMAQSGWDSFWDGAFDLVGKGTGDKLALAVSTSVIEAFRLMEEGPAKEEVKKSLENIIGQKVDFTSIKDLNEKIKDLDKAVLSSKAKEFFAVIDKSSKESSIAASNLTSFKGSLVEVNKEFDNLTNKLRPNDQYSKFGVTLIDSSDNLAKALQRPLEGAAALRELLKDMKTLSVLPTDTIVELTKTGIKLQEVEDKIADIKGNMQVLKGTETLSNAEREGIRNSTTTQKLGSAIAEAEKVRAIQVAGKQADLRDRLAAAEKDRADLVKAAKEASDALFTAGIAKLQIGLNKAMGEAAVISAKGYLDIVKGAGGSTAIQDTALQIQAVNLQIAELEATHSLTKTLINNSATVALLTEELKRKTQQEYVDSLKARTGSGAEGALVSAQSDLKTTENLIKIQQIVQKLSTGDDQTLLAAYQKGEGLKDLAPEIAAGVRAGIKTTALEVISKIGQVAKLNAQAGVISATGRANLVQENTAKETAKIDLSIAGKSAESSELARQQTLLGFYSRELSVSKDKLDIEILEGTATKERLESLSKIERLKIGGASAKDIETEYRKLTDNIAKSDKLQETAKQQQRTNALNGIEQIAAKDIEQANIRLGLNQEISKQEMAIQEARVAYSSTIGSLDQAEVIRQQTALESAKQQLDYAKQLADAKRSSSDAVGAIDVKLQQLPDGSAAKTKLNADKADLLENNRLQVEGITKANEARKLALELTSKQKILEAEQAERMKDIVSLTVSLVGAFDSVGGAIGATIAGMQKFVDLQVNYQLQSVDLEKQRNKALEEQAKLRDDPTSSEEDRASAAKKVISLTERQGKLESKNQAMAVEGVADLAGATKNMFDTKSMAYKRFSQIEQAGHLISMAIKAKEMAADLMALPGKIAGGVSKLFSQGGWAGFAGAAAFLALMVSLGGGSKGATIPEAGASAADQQKVQGTGQSYANGQIVANGGGALGDASAKSESVNNSIEMIEKHSFKNLEFSNKMLSALLDIKENTQSLGKALITIQGLTTMDPSSSGGNWLFGKTETSVVDKGIQLTGNIASIIAGAGSLTQYRNIKQESSGFLGFGGGTSFSTQSEGLNSPGVTKGIADLFGSMQLALVEAGKSLGVEGVKAFTDAINISPDSFKISTMGLKGQELVDAIVAQIGIVMDIAGAQVFPALRGFQKMGESFSETVIRIARDGEVVTLALQSAGLVLAGINDVNRINSFENLIKLTGGLEEFVSKTESFKNNFLTAAEQLAPVQAAVTKEMARLGLAGVTTRAQFAAVVKGLDLTQAAAQSLYADLMNVSDAFAEVHEETRKTLDAQSLLTAQLDQQITILQLLGKTSEALALSRQKELDSLDPALVAGQKYIYQLQDATASIKNQTELIAALGDANGALQVTREMELRGLTDEARLLKKQVYAAQDAIKTNSLLIQIMELAGDATGALNAKRQLEINAMSDADAAIQTRIYRLQDEAALTAKIKTAYTAEAAAINTTITALKSSIKTLKDYRTSLTIGASSTLSPAQKYEETKAEALRIAALASSIAVSDAEKASKQEAIDALPAATDAFLSASQLMYASSDNYTRDFQSVLAMIDSTSSALTTQLSTAELQLAALDASVAHLSIIEASSETTAVLLQQLYDLQASALMSRTTDTTLSTGALTQAQDPSMGVLDTQSGSPNMQIPSPVTPGMMTAQSANNTSDAIAASNALLLAQVRVMTDELATLRSEQQAQTLHMLQMQQAVADQLVASQQAAVAQQAANDDWIIRNQIAEYTASMGQ